MSPWFNAVLDLCLICFVAAGLVQAARLLHQLNGLRQGRAEMERFVQEFSAAIMRAENGIKDLRNAARISGDDLEKLLEKSSSMRDELMFIIESADKVAGRLTSTAASTARPAAKSATVSEAPSQQTASVVAQKGAGPGPQQTASSSSNASRAEKELMQALEKLG
jgi:hypothetical protein